MNCNYYIRR